MNTDCINYYINKNDLIYADCLFISINNDSIVEIICNSQLNAIKIPYICISDYTQNINSNSIKMDNYFCNKDRTRYNILNNISIYRYM
jgi:hypothetical protein